MDNQQLIVYVLAATTLVGVVGLLVFVGFLTRSLSAVTAALNEVNRNPKALDTIESAAIKVVPAWLIPLILSNGEGFKQLIQTAEGKAFMDAILMFVRQTTDGLPNTPTANANPNG